MGVALGSFLSGAETGMMDAKKQSLAEKTEADQNTIQQGQLGLSQNKFTFEQKQAAAARIDSAVAQIWQSMVNTHDRFADAGHMPEDAKPAIDALSQHAIDLLNLGGMGQYAKAFQAKADSLIQTPANDTRPKYEKSGVDPYSGKDIMAQVNPAAPGGITKPEQLTATATDFLPKDANGKVIGGMAGLEALRQRSPTEAAIIEMMLSGKRAPPSSFAVGKEPIWAQRVAIAHLIDPSYDETTYGDRVKAAADYATTKNGTAGGAINAGQGAMNHLADVSDASVKLPNIDSGIPGVAYVANKGSHLAAQSTKKTGPYIDYNTAAGKFAPEVTRLYINLGGTEKERSSEVKDFNDEASRTEQGHILLANTRLILEKLQPLDVRYRKEVTNQFAPPIMTPSMVNSTDRVLKNAVALDPSLKDEADELRKNYFPLSGNGTLVTPDQQGKGNAVPPAGGQQVVTQQDRDQDFANAQAFMQKFPNKIPQVMQMLQGKYGVVPPAPAPGAPAPGGPAPGAPQPQQQVY